VQNSQNNLKMKKRPFGVSFCVEIVVWCKRGSFGLFCFAGLFRVIGHFVLIQRAMELVFNWPHRPLKLFERTLRVDKTC
jgi:hypothetical protein